MRAIQWLQMAAVLSLAGCAAIQPQEPASDAATHQRHLESIANIHQFSVQGRIGVQTEGRGFSGSTHWQHSATQDNIDLFSPLGGQVANIQATPESVVLVDSDGKTYRAQDAETLTQKTLGWRLPMKGLPDWVLGRPAPGKVEDSQWDRNGRLTRLKQQGWDISYGQYVDSQGYQLPGKIMLESRKLNLKLVIERWELPQLKDAGANAGL
ncbi:MAG TPA: lipoprotein insertase outer membrane protein LolB [Methylophilaceae bacterium]|nr:lipoprotein insertase outer membrane protein LolB [Methylophilaceae bacterium]